jgi:hypothetical protein
MQMFQQVPFVNWIELVDGWFRHGFVIKFARLPEFSIRSENTVKNSTDKL